MNVLKCIIQKYVITFFNYCMCMCILTYISFNFHVSIKITIIVIYTYNVLLFFRYAFTGITCDVKIVSSVNY